MATWFCISLMFLAMDVTSCSQPTLTVYRKCTHTTQFAKNTQQYALNKVGWSLTSLSSTNTATSETTANKERQEITTDTLYTSATLTQV